MLPGCDFYAALCGGRRGCDCGFCCGVCRLCGRPGLCNFNSILTYKIGWSESEYCSRQPVCLVLAKQPAFCFYKSVNSTVGRYQKKLKKHSGSDLLLLSNYGFGYFFKNLWITVPQKNQTNRFGSVATVQFTVLGYFCSQRLWITGTTKKTNWIRCTVQLTDLGASSNDDK